MRCPKSPLSEPPNISSPALTQALITPEDPTTSSLGLGSRCLAGMFAQSQVLQLEARVVPILPGGAAVMGIPHLSSSDMSYCSTPDCSKAIRTPFKAGWMRWCPDNFSRIPFPEAKTGVTQQVQDVGDVGEWKGTSPWPSLLWHQLFFHFHYPTLKIQKVVPCLTSVLPLLCKQWRT